MAILTRIVAAAALVSIVFADIAGASAPDTYRRAAQHARSYPKRGSHVNLEKRSKRCSSGVSTSLSTTAPYTKSTPNSISHRHTHSHSTSTTSTANPEQTSSKPSSSGPKKGLAWGGEAKYMHNFVNENIAYVYNWGPKPPQGHGPTSASMLWGYKDLVAFRQTRENYKILMGPNEFNLGSQADLSVPQVVKLWNAEIRPYKKGRTLVAPSVTSAPNGLTQMQEFFSQCGAHDGEPHCGVDVLSLHYYSHEAKDLIAYVTKMHNELFGIDVWLSEFACESFTGKGACTDQESWAFMEAVVEFCENTSWIVGYFPYGFMSNLGNVNSVNSLYFSDGTPTALGKYFLKTTY